MKTKICTKCYTAKEPESFPANKLTISGRGSWCRRCLLDYQRESRKKPEVLLKKKEAAKEYRNKPGIRKKSQGFHLKKFWLGSTVDEANKNYNALFVSQNGRCAICSRHQSEFNKSLAVDHDHNTGAVRGLLCALCNTGIGALQDNVLVLSKAIAYINNYTNRKEK